ncbi:MAG: asparagine synthase (glutamine-hydrolyzing) [Proteobacteria bacterium]|nr:asparagine synthase (glutamine-hydrolyzing) [Pseudomonadota bacterium]
MCGITGLFGSFDKDSLFVQLQAMTQSLKHRGPDGEGYWLDKNIGFGHRRLAVVDLSEAGHQPMTSSCGRYVLSYNGETYSNQELKPILEAKGIILRGYSDTEVILESCATLGLFQTLKQLIGMFAFSLWDKKEQTLYLTRDRLGIKPLYWGFYEKGIAFASELKALRTLQNMAFEVNLDALFCYLRYGYIPTPLTIYKNIQKLKPATVLTFKKGEDPTFSSYWDLKTIAEEGQKNLIIDKEEALFELETLLKDAIARRMIADVPLGAFLSGGIDSSLVVALMQAQSRKPIKTFSIGFHEKEYNEALHAQAVAHHLKTDHTELYVCEEEAQQVIPLLPSMYDEPFADSSQIPTYLVSKLAREHVTVSLSGDGGDELFSGYNRYTLGQSVWDSLQRVPLPQVVGHLIQRIPVSSWNKIGWLLRNPHRFGERAHKLAQLMLSETPSDFYKFLISQWPNPSLLMPDIQEPNLDQYDFSELSHGDMIERMQLVDTMSYLPDDILTKVDRASMYVSLESRVPLLDHRLVSLSWRLPKELKRQGTTGKWCLRQILYRYVPKNILDRPKMGFGIPLDKWIRSSLKDWAYSLLNEKSLSGYFDPKPILQAFDQHQKGFSNHQYALWVVLMFQAWREKWGF